VSRNRDDWIDAAWEALGEGGVEGVRIEQLARGLGVTKGSFYWHFRNRQGLIDALLDRWFSLREENRAEFLAENPDPVERMWKVIERGITRGTRGQAAALRFWAQRHPEVAKRIEEADARRIAMFVDQFRALGFRDDEARKRAEVYQAVITAEFIRVGSHSVEDRLAAARRQHELLVNGGHTE
jgi:AcrR family transcriptional regulator